MIHMSSCRTVQTAAVLTMVIVIFAVATSDRTRADALLDEIVEFNGQILFIESKVPAVRHWRDPQWRNFSQRFW